MGASASGVQIADELARSGRDVVLAVGRHTRVPRRYRGMDLFWWLETTGRLARTIDDVPDPAAARREPSLQLVGRSARRRGGERGRPGGAPASRRPADRPAPEPRRTHGASSATSSTALTADADRRMHALLDSIDRYVDRAGLTREVLAPVRPKRGPVGRRAVPARPARGRDRDGRAGDRLPPRQRLGRAADHATPTGPSARPAE